MTKEDMMNEWRKQRKMTVSSSEIGQRPVYDSSAANSTEYQLSSEPALFSSETITCCKHGIKCKEYYNQKFDSEKIFSLWPISELLGQTDQMKTASISPISSKFKQGSAINRTDQYNKHFYDNISRKRNDPVKKSIEPLSKSDSTEEISPESKSAAEGLPENATKLEVLRRFYLGQKPRSASISLARIAQNFALYHELPDDDNNLNSLKQYAPLRIVYVNNDLEYRYLPIQECFVNGKRRVFVVCGDKNTKSFKKLEYLVRYYAKMFAYTDRQGRRSRFPDNIIEQ